MAQGDHSNLYDSRGRLKNDPGSPSGGAGAAPRQGAGQDEGLQRSIESLNQRIAGLEQLLAITLMGANANATGFTPQTGGEYDRDRGVTTGNPASRPMSESPFTSDNPASFEFVAQPTSRPEPDDAEEDQAQATETAAPPPAPAPTEPEPEPEPQEPTAPPVSEDESGDDEQPDTPDAPEPSEPESRHDQAKRLSPEAKQAIEDAADGHEGRRRTMIRNATDAIQSGEATNQDVIDEAQRVSGGQPESEPGQEQKPESVESRETQDGGADDNMAKDQNEELKQWMLTVFADSLREQLVVS